ncbi:multidrug efflux pump subunit AcrA (membrane-fusion protein) [Desulfitispora alkaliphila]|uniref:efflux RND transporter periplasmic adaptor subunit n=1 Tax=Desulfitispora alkaliphila TaxID=622674 RepID=UPI003D203743
MAQRISMILLILIVVFGGGYYAYQELVPPPEEEARGPVYATKEVVRGDLSVGVDTSGPLNPSRGGSIQVPGARNSGMNSSGRSYSYLVEDIMVEEGEEVTQGQTIVKLSSAELMTDIEDMEDRIKENKEYLADLLNIPVNEADRANPAQGITLHAPIEGRVTELSVTEGEDVRQSQIVARVVDDSRFYMTAYLTPNEIPNVEVGQTAYLTFSQFDGRVEVKVTEVVADPVPVAQSELMDSYGIGGERDEERYINVHWVTLEGVNEGLIRTGMKAKIELNNRALRYETRVEGFVNEERILSRAEGVATNVFVKNMQRVNEGDPIVSLAGEDTRELIQERISEIRDQESELRQLWSQLDNLEVKAPMAGVVARVNSEPGQMVSAGDWIGHIYNTDDMYLGARIDDIDVVLVQQGAPVKITLDAMPGENFEGEVRHVSTMGHDSDGMTRFHVDIQVKGSPEMRPGMQAQAHIEGGSVEDALLVPLEAVFEDDGQTKVEIINEDGTVEMVTVELGLMDDRLVEVKSGLEEGQEVITGSTDDLLPSQGVQSQDGLLPETRGN